MKSFDWANIDRGFRGFEDLAFDYVKKEYGIVNAWEHTPYTQDGNRDGYSIICGFRPHDLSPEEWWMEAKYSTQKQRISRYRLDSTIVSAAIHGNVSKIIFVTNVSINTKTIIDIRAALKSSIHCREVYFCVKSSLEYWLKQNPEIFQTYFPDTDINTLLINPLFLSEEIEFFSNQKMGLCVSEPLNCIQLEKEYYLYFSVYSNCKQTLSLSINNGFSNITVLSPTQIDLEIGVTPCAIKIFLNSNYSMKYKFPDGRTVERSDILDGALLKLGSLELVVKKALEVIAAPERKLYILSQEENFKQLQTSYQTALKQMRASVNFLIGTSGTGKTYLMERFIRENVDLEQSAFHISFSAHQITNDLKIYYFLVFCLYPYLPPDMVDETYLKNLHDSNLESSIIYRASKYFQQPDRLHQFYISTINEDIFPANLSLNFRIILLDDLHKLSAESLSFLLTVIAELAEKRQPIFVLATSWPEINDSAAYQAIKQNIYLQKLDCIINNDDLAEIINSAEILDFPFNPQLCNVIFPSIIELLIFIKYFDGTKLHTFEDFLIASRLFLGSATAQECILDRFQKLFSIDKKSMELCNRIYWSVEGIPMHDPMTKTETKLLQYELIKVNDYNTKLIPYHDLYRQIFCQRFERQYTTNEQAEDIYTHTARIFEVGGTKYQLAQSIKQIQQWKQQGRFYAILYVLEDIFETPKKNNLRSKIGDVAYFQLYLCYAFGVANVSQTKSGKIVFQEIVTQSNSESNPEILLVRMDAIFELINSNFEWLMYDNAKKYITQIDNLICSLQKLRKLPQDINKCEKYILTRQIELLMSSESEDSQTQILFEALDQTTKKNNFDYEHEFFRLRFAETLYFRDTTFALDMVKACRDQLFRLRGSEEKFYLWAKMDYEFLLFILDDPQANFNQLCDAHNMLKKDCFNDYRKRLFALACIYYSIGLVESGDQILFSDVATLRQLRPRQEAFYAETLALHYALYGNFDRALLELQKAAALFKNFPSYLTIIHHNQDILKREAFCSNKIYFCTNKICYPDWYCIDPRCIW